MNLLKYLVCDHIDMKDGEPTNNGVDANTGLNELNSFAYAFCSLLPSQLRLANFDAHLKEVRYNGNEGDARSGAKGDACQVLVLVLTRHFNPVDGHSKQSPGSSISMDDVLTTVEAKRTFENWMVQIVSKDVQNAIKKTKESSSIPTQIMPKSNTTGLSSNPFGIDGDDDDIVNVFKPDNSRKVINAEASADRQHRLEKIGIQLDIQDKENADGPPTCWQDSALANQQVQLSVAEGVATTNDKTKEKWSEQIEERKRLIGRDPMGIRPDNFDLKSIKDRVIQVLDGCVEDLEEEIQEGGHHTRATDETKRKKKDKYAYFVEQIVSLEAQKAALEAILDGEQVDVDDEDAEEKRSSAAELSILPADSNFDPLLFLTIVHRDTGYEQLHDSITMLESEYKKLSSHFCVFIIDIVIIIILTSIAYFPYRQNGQPNSKNSATYP